MKKPLEGIKVLELSTYVAAPIAAKMLGEWGADVIKVEPRYGDEYRVIGQTLQMPTEEVQNPCFDLENMSKRAISINIKDEDGKKILHNLLSQSDVLITNYREEALEKLNLTYEELKDLYPKLVYSQVVGYGLKGPDCNKPGFDLTAFFARSGLMLDPVEKDTSPMNTLVAVGDHATGVSLVAGINAALIKSIRTGKGDKVVSGLYQNSLFLCSSMITGSEYGVNYPISRKEAISPLVNSYKCKDGEWILLAGTSYDHYWKKMAKDVLNDEQLANNPKYENVGKMVKNKKEMIEIFDRKFQEKTRDEWEILLNKADIANEKILHWKDVLNDRQALENNYIYKAQYENGNTSTLVRTPVDIDSVKEKEFKPAPKIGEHTEEILLELGYSIDEIKKLYSDKKIK